MARISLFPGLVGLVLVGMLASACDRASLHGGANKMQTSDGKGAGRKGGPGSGTSSGKDSHRGTLGGSGSGPASGGARGGNSGGAAGGTSGGPRVGPSDLSEGNPAAISDDDTHADISDDPASGASGGAVTKDAAELGPDADGTTGVSASVGGTKGVNTNVGGAPGIGSGADAEVGEPSVLASDANLDLGEASGSASEAASDDDAITFEDGSGDGNAMLTSGLGFGFDGQKSNPRDYDFDDLIVCVRAAGSSFSLPPAPGGGNPLPKATANLEAYVSVRGDFGNCRARFEVRLLVGGSESLLMSGVSVPKAASSVGPFPIAAGARLRVLVEPLDQCSTGKTYFSENVDAFRILPASCN